MDILFYYYIPLEFIVVDGICTMSGKSSCAEDADDAIRLVNVRADALLKTSATARHLLGADLSLRKSNSSGRSDGCACPSNLSSSVKGTEMSVCSSKGSVTPTLTVCSISNNHLQVTHQSGTPGVITTATELSNDCVSDKRIVQEDRFLCDSLTSSSQSSMLLNTPDAATWMMQNTVPDNAVMADNRQLQGDINDDPVTNKPSSFVLSQSPCKNLLENSSVSENPELLQYNFQPERSDAVTNCYLQSTATVVECLSDDCKIDILIASKDSREPSAVEPSLPCQQLNCNNKETSEQTDKMEHKHDSDQQQKTTASCETENDQPEPSAEVEMQLNRTENKVEHNIPVKNCAVVRDDTAKSVSQRPSRIVSFTTEDFDLFQSKYVAICNLLVMFFYTTELSSCLYSHHCIVKFSYIDLFLSILFTYLFLV